MKSKNRASADPEADPVAVEGPVAQAVAKDDSIKLENFPLFGAKVPPPADYMARQNFPDLIDVGLEMALNGNADIPKQSPCPISICRLSRCFGRRTRKGLKCCLASLVVLLVLCGVVWKIWHSTVQAEKLLATTTTTTVTITTSAEKTTTTGETTTSTTTTTTTKYCHWIFEKIAFAQGQMEGSQQWQPVVLISNIGDPKKHGAKMYIVDGTEGSHTDIDYESCHTKVQDYTGTPYSLNAASCPFYKESYVYYKFRGQEFAAVVAERYDQGILIQEETIIMKPITLFLTFARCTAAVSTYN